MRLKKIIFPLILTAAIGTAATLAAPKILKTILTQQINARLAPYGLGPVDFRLTFVTPGSLTLEDVTLDSGGIDTIDRVSLQFSLSDLLHGEVSGLALTRPDLTFETALFDPQAGGQQIPSLPSLWRIPLKSLEISEGRLSLMGESNSVTLTGSLSLMTTQAKPASRILTVKLKSAEKDIALAGRFEIEESETGTRTLLLDLPEARFDMDPVRLSRANGRMKILAAPGKEIRIEGKMSAGALKIGHLPLEDLTLTASGGTAGVQMDLDAGISGLTESGLHLHFSEEGDGVRTILQVSGFQPRALAKMIAPDMARFLPEQQTYALSLSRKSRWLSEAFALATPGELNLFLGTTSPVARAFLACTAPFVCALESPDQTLNLADIAPALNTALAETRLRLSSGQIHLDKGLTLSLPDKNLTGSLQGQDIALRWNDLPLDRASGQLSFARGTPPVLTHATGRLMKGTLALDRILISPTSENPTHLTLTGIDLAALSQLARIDGLEMTGTLSGALPVSVKNGEIYLEDGTTLTGMTGLLRYQPGTYPAFLRGEDERMDVLRRSLTDYRFDSLTLNAAGNLNGLIKARMEAKGHNAALFGTRPIHLNLNLEGPLTPALRGILPSFTQAPNLSPSDLPTKESP